MTLGKGHLMATVPLFLAAMGYNVWYFTQNDAGIPARPAAQQSPSASDGPSVAGAAAVPVDPTQIPAAPDVTLDRIPAWRRNPFVDTRRPPPAPVEAGVQVEAVPETEPDIVVSMVMHGANPRARVNGRTVRVGDRVGTALIVEIVPNGVVIESPTQGRRTITTRRGSSPAARGAR